MGRFFRSFNAKIRPTLVSPSKRRRLALEPLESRRLLAVEALDLSFMTVQYELSWNSFSGSDRYNVPGDFPDYRAIFQGSITNETATVTYQDQFIGTGSGSGSGSYYGRENYQPSAIDWAPFSGTFSGSGTATDNNGVFERVLVSGTAVGSGTLNAYTPTMTGTFNVSKLPFKMDLRFRETYDQGNGVTQGNFKGHVVPVSAEAYDIEITQLRWRRTDATVDDVPTLELEYQVHGPPQPTANRGMPIANVKLFWAKGTERRDIISGAIDEPIPIYWNQAGGKFAVSDLPVPPASATHLLAYADYDGKVLESDDYDNNIGAIRLGALREVFWNIERVTKNSQAGHRGIDAEYFVAGGLLPAGTRLDWYWSTTPNLEGALSRVDSYTLSAAERSLGKHVINNKAHWDVPPEEAQYVVAELVRPDGELPSLPHEFDVLPSVEAVRLHSQSEIMSGAVVFETGSHPWEIYGHFRPGGEVSEGGAALTMSEAEVVFGVDHFNWYQTLQYPSYMEMRRNGVPQGRPYVDPHPEVENLNELTLHSPFHDPDQPSSERFAADFVDAFPFYHHETQVTGSGEIEVRSETALSLRFYDAPRIPEDLYDPDGDDYQEFRTELVGVSATGGLILLPVAADSKAVLWKSDAGYYRPGPGGVGGVALYFNDSMTAPQPEVGGVSGIAPDTAAAAFSAANDAATTSVNTAASINALANDSLGGLTTVFLSSAFGADHGSVTIHDAGTPADFTDDRILYTPQAGYQGLDSFQYILQDESSLGFATATVTVQVGAPLARAGGVFQVYETGTIVLSAEGGPAESTSPPVFEWDLDDDGIFGEVDGSGERGDEIGRRPAFEAAALDGSGGTLHVGLRIRYDEDQLTPTINVPIQILNAPPIVLEVYDSEGAMTVAPGATLELFAAVLDALGDDVHTLTWDLDGDGVFGESGGNARRGDESGESVTFQAHNLSGISGNRAPISVQATDKDGGISAVFSTMVVIEGLQNPPTEILLSAATLRENLQGGAVGTLSAVDEDNGDQHTFTVDDPRFGVSPSGQLQLRAGFALDYEAEAAVPLVVTATDSAGYVYQQSLDVTILDVNDPPFVWQGVLHDLFISNDSDIVPLGLDSIEYDPDDWEQNQELSYRVLTLPTPAAGLVYLADGITPVEADTDYTYEQLSGMLFRPAEVSATTTTTFTFAVRDDGGAANGGSDQLLQTVSIQVIAYGSPPDDVSLSAAALGAGLPIGALVGVLSTTDADPEDGHTYTLVPGEGSTDNARFTIEGDKLRAASTFSVGETVSIRVRATDDIGFGTEKAFTLEVVDLGSLDFGDAPASYGTLLQDNGPRHHVVAGLALGTTIGPDVDGQPTPTASADNDDGVVLPAILRDRMDIPILITASGGGVLDAWIDFDRSGVFDPGERITSITVAGGTQQIMIRVPDGASYGATYARFRLSSGGGLSPTGEAPDGEVEDYRVTIGPLTFQHPWQSLDVDHSGSITSSDAVTVIDYLHFLLPNAEGNIELPPQPPNESLDPLGGGPGQALFLDVNGDGFLTAADAVIVIDALNLAAGDGEGESKAPVPWWLVTLNAEEIELGKRHARAQDLALAEILAEWAESKHYDV